jgi:hypothetical protein
MQLKPAVIMELLEAHLNCKCYKKEDNSLHGHVEENQANSRLVKF